jgi:plasmid stability protein
MASLIVRNIEKSVVLKLKQRAAKSGVSTEEEVRRILRGSVAPTRKLKSKARPKMTLLEYLCTMPNVGKDSDFRIPRRGRMRFVDLSD